MRGYGALPVARRHPALALLFAGWLLGLALESAPHLVHHLFDEDDGAGCGFLATTHHTPAATHAPVLVPRSLATAERPLLWLSLFRPGPEPRPASARGPPAACLAAA
jgi:hypothetical protein